MDFGINTSKYKVLTRQQEQELFRDYHEGSKAAFDALVLHNLGLVAKAVSKFRGRRNAAITDEDYFNEGIIGLMTAIRKFEPHRGLKLSTFACPWIFQAISRAETTKAAAIRLPQHAAEIRMRMVSNNCFDPAEIARREGCQRQTAEAILATGFELMELDRPFKTKGFQTHNNNTLLDAADGSEFQYHVTTTDDNSPDFGIDLHRLLSLMPDTTASRRSIEMIKYRYGLMTGKTETLEAISKRFNCTRERVRQICERAIGQLRQKAEVEKRRLAIVKAGRRH